MANRFSFIAAGIAELIRPGYSQPGQAPTSTDIFENPEEWFYVPEPETSRVLACLRLRRLTFYAWEISCLNTRPEHQRKGLAKELIALASRYAEEQGGGIILATVRADNFVSLRLMKRAGFELLPCTATNPATNTLSYIYQLCL